MSKKIIIIAGPNGAGKTTFARSFLPAEAQCPRFINADLIAAGLSPFAPEAAAIKAGRLRKWPLREWPSVSSKGGMIFPKWSFAVGLRQDGKISRIIVNGYILGFYTITPAVNPS